LSDQGSERRRLVLDTNVFVAAGFNPRSHSAEIIRRAREDNWQVVWNEETRRETLRLLNQIPPLSREEFAGVFREKNRFVGPVDPGQFRFIEDPDDRKYAALAEASGATLVTNDDHLLSKRGRLGIPVMTPGEFLRSVEAPSQV
jgi:predicted nucleic acid-binding protein